MKWMLLALPAAVLASPAAAQVMDPTEYVATSGASDLYERQSSEVVLQTTQNPRVRQFAQMMIDHHTKSTADVKAAAARARVPAPEPKLMPLQQQLVAELRAEPATTRDLRYIAQQKASHNQALEVQKAYAAEGAAAPLKDAAAKIVPVVQSHIRMLMEM